MSDSFAEYMKKVREQEARDRAAFTGITPLDGPAMVFRGDVMVLAEGVVSAMERIRCALDALKKREAANG